MASTVTIDKAYFETLLRRAEFHASGKDLTTPIDLPTVTIPKVDHDNLLRMAREYAALREALYHGGIAEETLAVLIHGDMAAQPPVDDWRDNDGDASESVTFSWPQKSAMNLPAPVENSFIQRSGFRWPSQERSDHGSLGERPRFHNTKTSYGHDNTSFPSEPDKDDPFMTESRPEIQRYAKVEQRTLLFRNLSDRTTHKDVVDIVRGGAVLDIYLRAIDRTASVSFVEGSAAQNFLNYAKRHDIYMHGKRVEVTWNDRQFILPGHVANKIGIGATRNLILRNVHPNITAKRIREDLDHIHNLVIIDVSLQSGNTLISLNSIHNSLFARTCMMSRGTYKGMKIEWSPDECAQPLPKIQHVPKNDNAPPPIKKKESTLNRFQMLNMDGTEDGSEDENGQHLTTYPNMTPRVGWNTSTITA